MFSAITTASNTVPPTLSHTVYPDIYTLEYCYPFLPTYFKSNLKNRAVDFAPPEPALGVYGVSGHLSLRNVSKANKIQTSQLTFAGHRM